MSLASDTISSLAKRQTCMKSRETTSRRIKTKPEMWIVQSRLWTCCNRRNWFELCRHVRSDGAGPPEHWKGLARLITNDRRIDKSLVVSRRNFVQFTTDARLWTFPNLFSKLRRASANKLRLSQAKTSPETFIFSLLTQIVYLNANWVEFDQQSTMKACGRRNWLKLLAHWNIQLGNFLLRSCREQCIDDQLLCTRTD